jgi:hypothetical protein
MWRLRARDVSFRSQAVSGHAEAESHKNRHEIGGAMKDLSVSTANWKNENRLWADENVDRLKFREDDGLGCFRGTLNVIKFYFWCGVIVVATVAIVKAIR